jgi:hypothetical protein
MPDLIKAFSILNILILDLFEIWCLVLEICFSFGAWDLLTEHVLYCFQ